MGIFDFLSGTGGASYDPQATQPYQQFQPTTDYSQLLGGGQSQSPATQGLDLNKIGDWATQMAQKTQFAQHPQQANFQGVLAGGNASAAQGPNMQQLLGAMGATQATQPTQGSMSPLQAHARAVQLGQVSQGQSGYIGNGTRSGLLGMMR